MLHPFPQAGQNRRQVHDITITNYAFREVIGPVTMQILELLRRLKKLATVDGPHNAFLCICPLNTSLDPR
jgi:hypothetical protein